MARPSKIVKCLICGKEVRARGLYGHRKLKDHVIFSNVTRVNSENFNDSSGDSGKTEKKVSDSSRKSKIKKIKIENLETLAKSKFPGLKGLEADYLQFRPMFFDYLKHYRKNPELALKQWERITRLEKQYAWPILINPESYRALRHIFG